MCIPVHGAQSSLAVSCLASAVSSPSSCAALHALRHAQVPLSYPFVEAFRLSMLAMSHVNFPFNVLGAVLARNSSKMVRPIQVDDVLTYT